MSKPIPARSAARPVPVVTVFLSHNDTVALFKRSSRVGSYRGLWAGVSGYVERIPLRQAYAEIAEETRLSRRDVKLRGMGVPFLVQDAQIDRVWAVHPFLFAVDRPDAIRISWEADAVEWVTPDEIKSRETVPGLHKALSQVWPTAGDALFWADMERAAVDTVNGAAAIALAALSSAESCIQRCGGAVIDRIARTLAACRPSMGIFPHLASRMLVEKPAPGVLGEQLQHALSESASKAASALEPCRRVITLSYSSAVRQALLLRARSGSFHVLVMESRPGLEGLVLARELAAEGVEVTVITDAQAGLFVNEVDAVVVGCDAVSGLDELHNKAGTSMVVSCARSRTVPCFSVAQSFKIAPVGYPLLLEEQDAESLAAPRGVKARNVVFDTTQLASFEAVYTEHGPLTSELLTAVRGRLADADII